MNTSMPEHNCEERINESEEPTPPGEDGTIVILEIEGFIKKYVLKVQNPGNPISPEGVLYFGNGTEERRYDAYEYPIASVFSKPLMQGETWDDTVSELKRRVCKEWESQQK